MGGFEECGAIELDAPYYFGDMSLQTWSLTHKQDITPRSVWNFEAWRVKYDLGTFWQKSGLSDSDMCDPANVEASAWFAQPGEAEEAAQRLKSDAEKEAAGIPIVSSSNTDEKEKPAKPESAPEKPAPKPEDAPEKSAPEKPAPKSDDASTLPEKPAPKPEDKPAKAEKAEGDKPKPPPKKAGRKSASERRAARVEMVNVEPLIEDDRVVMVWGGVVLAVVALVLFALSRRTKKSVEEGYEDTKVEMTGSYGATVKAQC